VCDDDRDFKFEAKSVRSKGNVYRETVAADSIVANYILIIQVSGLSTE